MVRVMPPTVLIADDEHHIRMLIEQSLRELEDEGAEILTAPDGEEALRLARETRPAVLLLDVMMPKVNGFDVCEQLKREQPAQAPFIILLTAKGQAFDRQRGDEVGADRYITKPFDPDQLLATVREALA
jgi:two-component system, OmpR family, alkaline phosphatase synthesis response regulator PhoP